MLDKRVLAYSSPASSTKEKITEDNIKSQPRRLRFHVVIISIVIVVIVLALALGLGLGLGLRSSHSRHASSNGSSQTGANATNETTGTLSTTSQNVPSWRRSTEDYALDLKSWDFDAAPTTRSYNWTLTELDIAPDGVTRKVLAVNGQFPGPLIRANRGDRLLINVHNQLSNATAVHWHGMFQNGTNFMDGTAGITQCPIPPGRSFSYNFTVDNQYGTYWWHSHYSMQYTDGILGPLIIHAPEEKQAQKGYDFDQVVLIQDWYHDLSAALLPGYLAPDNENNEPVPDAGLIQGTN